MSDLFQGNLGEIGIPGMQGLVGEKVSILLSSVQQATNSNCHFEIS